MKTEFKKVSIGTKFKHPSLQGEFIKTSDFEWINTNTNEKGKVYHGDFDVEVQDKFELPSAEKFVKEEIGWTPPKVRKVMQKYGELCAKHGAKSIRYQVIELLQNEGYSAFGESLIAVNDELIAKIQNLNP